MPLERIIITFKKNGTYRGSSATDFDGLPVELSNPQLAAAVATLNTASLARVAELETAEQERDAAKAERDAKQAEAVAAREEREAARAENQQRIDEKNAEVQAVRAEKATEVQAARAEKQDAFAALQAASADRDKLANDIAGIIDTVHDNDDAVALIAVKVTDARKPAKDKAIAELDRQIAELRAKKEALKTP